MKRILPWTVGVAVLLAAGLCVIFRPNGDIGQFIQHPATVAWAQLFGALGAIAATWLAGRDALQEARRAKQQADHDHIERAMRSVISGSAFLRHGVEQARDASARQTWTLGEQRMIAADIAGAMGVLKAARLDELPNVRLVAIGITFQRLGSHAEFFIEDVRNSLSAKAVPPKELFDELAKSVADACDELDTEVRAVRAFIAEARA